MFLKKVFCAVFAYWPSALVLSLISLFYFTNRTAKTAKMDTLAKQKKNFLVHLSTKIPFSKFFEPLNLLTRMWVQLVFSSS